ncbi:MAG: acyl carrier protein [Clostridiales bacterium]|nr:acyl carrier protein [Clostridiales bacterium]
MKEKLLAILAEQIDMNVSELTDDKRFIEDLDMDSLDMVEMTVELEQELDCTFEQEDLEGIKTIGDLIGLIEKD